MSSSNITKLDSIDLGLELEIESDISITYKQLSLAASLVGLGGVYSLNHVKHKSS